MVLNGSWPLNERWKKLLSAHVGVDTDVITYTSPTLHLHFTYFYIMILSWIKPTWAVLDVDWFPLLCPPITSGLHFHLPHHEQ